MKKWKIVKCVVCKKNYKKDPKSFYALKTCDPCCKKECMKVFDFI